MAQKAVSRASSTQGVVPEQRVRLQQWAKSIADQ
jgi:hypothetical protein